MSYFISIKKVAVQPLLVLRAIILILLLQLIASDEVLKDLPRNRGAKEYGSHTTFQRVSTLASPPVNTPYVILYIDDRFTGTFNGPPKPTGFG